MFSSRHGADLPWHAGQEVEVIPVALAGRRASIVIRDYPQHNPTNTLLAHFRMIDAGRGEYEDWLRDIDENPHVWVRRQGSGLALGSMVGYTDEEITHARRVLTRLARLTEKESA